MAAWCTVSEVCVQGEAEDEWQRGVQRGAGGGDPQ